MGLHSGACEVQQSLPLCSAIRVQLSFMDGRRHDGKALTKGALQLHTKQPFDWKAKPHHGKAPMGWNLYDFAGLGLRIFTESEPDSDSLTNPDIPGQIIGHDNSSLMCPADAEPAGPATGRANL